MCANTLPSTEAAGLDLSEFLHNIRPNLEYLQTVLDSEQVQGIVNPTIQVECPGVRIAALNDLFNTRSTILELRSTVAALLISVDRLSNGGAA